VDAEKELRREGWRLMRSAVKPHRKSVSTGVLAGLGWTAARVAVPTMVGIAIDRTIVRHHDNGALLRWVIAILVVGGVQALCTSIRRYAAFQLAIRVETDIRMRLVAHLQRLHFAFHDESQTGQLMSRANSDIQQINNVVLLVPLTIASTVTMFAVLGILVYRSPGLAFFALATLPILNLAATRFTKRMYPVGLQLQQGLAEVSNVVEETVTGVRVVKGFGAERRQIESLRRQTETVYQRSIDAANLRSGFLPMIDLLPTLGLVGILWYGGHQVLAGHLTIGEIIAANFYVIMLIWPLRMVGMLLGQIPRAVSAGGRIHEVLATDAAVAERPDARPLPAGSGELRFEGVTFAYGRGRPVLEGLDLVIRGGEAVALVGATGSGKTTIARLVPRFYDVTAGRVLLDGADVRELRLTQLRRAIGIVFEDTFLFSESVRANIAFAQPDASMERVRAAARLAGAEVFIDELPNGYETIVGQHGFTLSGGQRQRISIARAVLSDPRVLILDDATSSVDPTKEHEIRAALAEVMHGRTTLIIAHRPATIALADRVVLLDDRRVVAEGTHDGLLATSEAYRSVLARAEIEGSGHQVAEEDAAELLPLSRDAR
jgi:ATP-binding cassette, subfamily B, bacterial